MKHHRFERDGIVSEVFLMDCMDGMKMYPEKYFDLACVDPPYGIGIANMNMGIGKTKKASKAKNRKWKPKDWDKNTPTEAYFVEVRMVCIDLIIWGGNYFNLHPCKHYIIWDKEIPNGLSFADCEFAWTSFNNAPRMFRHSAYLDKKGKFHPTQKPVALYDWIFKNYAKPRQKILDTHLGSGSSRIAAEKSGLHFVGFEIDEEYFNASIERFENHVKQPRLQLEVRELPEQKNLL